MTVETESLDCTLDAVPPTVPRELLELYLSGDHGPLSEKMLQSFEHLAQHTFVELDVEIRASLDLLLGTFLYLITRPDYVIDGHFAERFINLNPTISNLLAISSFRNSDAQLDMLRRQPSSFIKVLTLFSARNDEWFDPVELLRIHLRIASLWYGVYAAGYRNCVIRRDWCENLAAHFRISDPLLQPTVWAEKAYMGSTYVDGECDRIAKPQINAAFRTEMLKQFPPSPMAPPQRNKLAVLSGVWFPAHSVYRNYAAYVRALREKYHITFFELAGIGEQPDVSLFDEVHTINRDTWGQVVGGLRRGGFSLAYFPDVGMHRDSIALANMRFAPVQVASPGHSVSTFGAEIDYWISGVDVEPPNAPQRNYSERLVLLPGAGVIHNKPLYRPTGRVKSDERVIVNCSWTPQKLNFRFLGTLQQIIRRAERQVLLRVFPGRSLYDANGFLPFTIELTETLGAENVEVLGSLNYQEYMAFMEEGDFGLDSFHFGGCNTVADSLYLGKPIVVWQGDRWYNRIGPHMLRQVGLEELIATDETGFVERAVRMITDDDYRHAMTERLSRADLNTTIFSQADAPSFTRAIDYLIDNHDKLKDDPEREPIRIWSEVAEGAAGV